MDKVTLVLMREWHRQLMEAFDEACASLPAPERERVRQWNTSFHLRFRPPNEDDPKDQWHWAEVPGVPPSLLLMQAVIDRIGQQIDDLAGTESKQG